MADQHGASGSEASGTDKAKEKAREVKDRAEETAESVKAEARDKSQEAIHEGKEKARELGDQATRQARSKAEEQKDRVADGIRSVAEALRQGSRELPEDRQQYGGLLETVADRVENVSGYLSQRDVDTMARDARRFARDHTALFLGGAFTLGLTGARFLKSSGSEGRHHQDDREWDAASRPVTGSTPPRPERSYREYGRTTDEPTRGSEMRADEALSPYPRSSTPREATDRIQEEGGYA